MQLMGNLYGILMIKERGLEQFIWYVLDLQKIDWFSGKLKWTKNQADITAIPDLLKVLELSGSKRDN